MVMGTIPRIQMVMKLLVMNLPLYGVMKPSSLKDVPYRIDSVFAPSLFINLRTKHLFSPLLCLSNTASLQDNQRKHDVSYNLSASTYHHVIEDRLVIVPLVALLEFAGHVFEDA